MTTEFNIPEAIINAVNSVLKSDPQYADPKDCKDCCVMASTQLIRELYKVGVKGTLTGNYLHSWVLTEDEWNIDLTARQLSTLEPCPKIWKSTFDTWPSEIEKGRNMYSDGLMKKYHVEFEPYNTPIKRLSQHKRELVSSGLPINFISEDEKTFGKIYLSDRGEIIVGYKSIQGKLYEKEQGIYLIDANDEVLKSCKIIKT